ncbi:hypothetical protein IAD21_01330 [Abditibacteriota bacterium]|nr:hypothetical protein IAD21_01330 [Abditibacteriota bacterium]
MNNGCAGCFSLVAVVLVLLGAATFSASAGPKWGLAGAAFVGLSTLLWSSSHNKRD